MCCRYFMEESPELKPFVDAAMRSPLHYKMISALGRPLVFSGEVKPSDIAIAVAPDKNGRRAAYPMVWGFTGKGSLILNARVETADSKPSFQEAWKRRRCIIPASWYFEWQHIKTPDGKTKTRPGDRYMFQTKGARLTLLAGLYRIEEERGIKCPHFTILTRDAGEQIRSIHDRMPVILDAQAAGEWIRPDLDASALQLLAAGALTDPVFEKG